MKKKSNTLSNAFKQEMLLKCFLLIVFIFIDVHLVHQYLSCAGELKGPVFIKSGLSFVGSIVSITCTVYLIGYSITDIIKHMKGKSSIIKKDGKKSYSRRDFLNSIHNEINELIRTEYETPNIVFAKFVIEQIRNYYNEAPFCDDAALTERNKACMGNVYVNISRGNIVRVAIELYDFLDDYNTTRPMLSKSEVIVLNDLFIAYDQACLQELSKGENK